MMQDEQIKIATEMKKIIYFTCWNSILIIFIIPCITTGFTYLFLMMLTYCREPLSESSNILLSYMGNNFPIYYGVIVLFSLLVNIFYWHEKSQKKRSGCFIGTEYGKFSIAAHKIQKEDE